MYIQHIENSSN